MNEHDLRAQFALAVGALATGPEPLPERVRNAMQIVVMFLPKDMPAMFHQKTRGPAFTPGSDEDNSASAT